jgi:protein gp37
VAFVGDLYDKDIFEGSRRTIYDAIGKAYWHRFLVLTKQPQNMDGDKMPSNLALGVSVNQVGDLWRLDALRKVDADLLVASFEPLKQHLGKINLDGLGWIIVGAQTRPYRYPPIQAVWDLVSEAKEQHIPVFLKDTLKIKVQEYPESWVKMEEATR